MLGPHLSGGCANLVFAVCMARFTLQVFLCLFWWRKTRFMQQNTHQKNATTVSHFILWESGCSCVSIPCAGTLNIFIFYCSSLQLLINCMCLHGADFSHPITHPKFSPLHQLVIRAHLYLLSRQSSHHISQAATAGPTFKFLHYFPWPSSVQEQWLLVGRFFSCLFFFFFTFDKTNTPPKRKNKPKIDMQYVRMNDWRWLTQICLLLYMVTLYDYQ